ncbi:nucleoside diphosphate kinase domain protein [Oesophagostomum dentatum]|uniref:nucleoside-diphosphate kinase n=1 Tax=Oesophagostomum dentatum TaxID=61180 RepID=A0A0B1T6H4_OESDE|nr:nucleoside diphosphate kinase domain protein [Oesophagostomum dentatum]
MENPPQFGRAGLKGNESFLGKFFFGRLVRHVTSGPIVAMRVNGDVRRLLGSSHLYPLPTDGQFSTIRQRCALSDVRNVAHASDAEAAERELALFEPLPPPQPFLNEVLGSL